MLTLTDTMMDQLKSVNRKVNTLFEYATDKALFKQEEYWQRIGIAKRGDCDDYALEKRFRLMELDWKPHDLRLTICIAETGDYHLVLTVDHVLPIEEGEERPRTETLVLDNRYVNVMRWQDLPYKWVARQRGTEWVMIEEPPKS